MQVAIYIRCSTEQQEDSPDVQRSAIKEYCLRNSYFIVGEYEDLGVSGGMELEKRPGFSLLLSDIKRKNIEAVVVLRLDRLSRNLEDMLGYLRKAERSKLKTLYVMENFDGSNGRLMLQLVGAFAEHFRRDIGRKVLEHNRHKAAKGEWTHGVAPIGYLYDKNTKTLKIDDQRKDDVIQIFRTFINTNGSYSKTALRLNAAGIFTRNNNFWRDDGVRLVINNPIYRGLLTYDGIEAEHNAGAIIDSFISSSLENLIIRNQISKRNHQVSYPYSRLIRCIRCGQSYKVNRSPRCTYYVCRGRKEQGICDSNGISEKRLDAIVIPALLTMLKDIQIPQEAISGVFNEDKENVIKAAKITNLNDSKNRVKDLYISGHLTKEGMEEKLAQIDEQIVKLTEPGKKRLKLSQDEINFCLTALGDIWKVLKDEEKRKIIVMLIEKIDLNCSDNKINIIIHNKLGREVTEINI